MPEPIKIGWLGSALDGPGGGYDKIHRLAFDEAVEQGLLDRPVEFVLHAENGLPQRLGEERDRRLPVPGRRGLHRRRRRVQLRQRDHGRARSPTSSQVPLISWCGTERLQGDYCFRLGNGDCGGDAALVVGVAEAAGPPSASRC